MYVNLNHAARECFVTDFPRQVAALRPACLPFSGQLKMWKLEGLV